jgi:hypothetical protein
MLTVTKILDIFKNVARANEAYNTPKPPSSSGLGHLPFTEATGIQIPLGVLQVIRVKFNLELGSCFFWAFFHSLQSVCFLLLIIFVN